MMSKIIRKYNWIITLILVVFSNKIVFPQHIQPIDSLGDIWVVTIDKSGSMLNGTNPHTMALNVYNRLNDNKYLDSINFNKDKFLFFNSGYTWNIDKGLGNEISKAPRFDISFIHNTDGKLHSISDKKLLLDRIKSQISENNYDYKLSFVSQIRVFSIIKAVELLKSQNETTNFREIKVINITDDADINDQWLTDYKNLKKWAPNKVSEIGDITSKYIYNILKGRGYGILDEVFADEIITPHIWIYSYTTKQSMPEKAEDQKYFEISAFNGKQIEFISLTNNYKNDKILFFCFDSIVINNNKNIVNQKFDSLLNLKLNYKNGFTKNQVQLYGSFQVQYTDSIWGEHYKKYYFSQSESLPTEFRNSVILKIGLSFSALILIFLIYRFLILPNKNLVIIYSNQGKKYVLKRGYKHHWGRGIISVLSCVLHGDNLSVICKKHRNVKTKPFNSISDLNNSFLICSTHKLFSDNTIKENKITFNTTQTDIEDFYKTRSKIYPNLLKKVYNETGISIVRRILCNSDIKWIRKIGNLLVKISNHLNTKYYYAIPKSTNRNISFRHNTLIHNRFIIEFRTYLLESINDNNQQFKIYCLNKYYEESPNEKYSAIICCGITKDYIYWNVLLPEFDKEDTVSLRYVNNTFQFKQSKNNDSEQQISYNLKILQKEVRKHIKNGGKIKHYIITSSTNRNPHNFEITECSFPGFLFLVEDTSALKSQMLYSPFIDGQKSKKDIFLKKFKTENCHLYHSFLPMKLINGDFTLRKKVSDELIKITENSDAVLEVKNRTQVIFKNIKTEV
jgi:hypothetical protein